MLWPSTEGWASAAMKRFLAVLLLTAALAFGPVRPCAAAQDDQGTILGMSGSEFAITVAVLVTGARVLAVLLVGNRFLGPNVGTGLLALYLGHVVAEGAIYGLGAGAGAYALGSGSAEMDGLTPPRIRPDRIEGPLPADKRLPLDLATEPPSE